MTTSHINISNRKASFEYQFLDTYEAGILLTGTEIKSVRAGKVSIAEGFCTFINGELFIKNMHIEEYVQGNRFNHDPVRLRKLLLHKKELQKLETKSKDKGVAIIPVRMFINDRGFAKLVIALGRGKKIHDKREDMKLKEARRQLKNIKG